MQLEQTWRWFGPQDPVSLKEIKQTGATGIVSALHHIPIGEIWAVDEIIKRKNLVEAAGFNWSVVESVPVHEDIKQRHGDFKKYIQNYQQTLNNLGKCGIDTVCYNFMPVLDWSRTDLNVITDDGSITTKFEINVFAAFDIYILKRLNAAASYTSQQIEAAEKIFNSMDQQQKEKLIHTILLGFPGSLEAYTLDQFREKIAAYENIGVAELRENLRHFIKEISPVAEESHILLGIHPDDPPMSLLGLPRVVGNEQDVQFILDSYPSITNGLTFCSGSFGAGYKNDLVGMAEKFSERINFIHLRNCTRNTHGDFMEAPHLKGDVDMYGVMKVLVNEQIQRAAKLSANVRMPMRPDHGHLMIADMHKKGIYPGYSLAGRMRGLAELRGLEMGIRLSLSL
jgi:mannonate dehydratase